MAERYEIVEVDISGRRTFAVVAWNGHTCLGADAHWLTREYAERAMAEYAAGTRHHGARQEAIADGSDCGCPAFHHTCGIVSPDLRGECPDCSTGRPVCRFYDDHPGPHRKPRAGGTYV